MIVRCSARSLAVECHRQSCLGCLVCKEKAEGLLAAARVLEERRLLVAVACSVVKLRTLDSLVAAAFADNDGPYLFSGMQVGLGRICRCELVDVQSVGVDGNEAGSAYAQA